jgi:hypothetical protein
MKCAAQGGTFDRQQGQVSCVITTEEVGKNPKFTEETENTPTGQGNISNKQEQQESECQQDLCWRRLTAVDIEEGVEAATLRSGPSCPHSLNVVEGDSLLKNPSTPHPSPLQALKNTAMAVFWP